MYWKGLLIPKSLFCLPLSILQHLKSLPLIYFDLIMKEIPFREASAYTLLCGESRFSERILLMRQASLTYRVTTALVTPQRSSRGSLLRNKGRILAVCIPYQTTMGSFIILTVYMIRLFFSKTLSNSAAAAVKSKLFPELIGQIAIGQWLYTTPQANKIAFK